MELPKARDVGAAAALWIGDIMGKAVVPRQRRVSGGKNKTYERARTVVEKPENPEIGDVQQDAVLGVPEGQEVVVFEYDGRRVSLGLDEAEQEMWLSQRSLAEIFQKRSHTITEHIGSIFADGVVDKDSTTRKFRVVASDGKTYDVQHYNVDVMLAVALRLRQSKLAIEFQKWALALMRKKFKEALAIGRPIGREPDAGERIEDFFETKFETPVVRAAPPRKCEAFQQLVAFGRPIEHVYIDMDMCELGDETLRCALLGKQLANEPVVLGVGSEPAAEELQIFMGRYGLKRDFFAIVDRNLIRSIA
jgi:hypothetical protein